MTPTRGNSELPWMVGVYARSVERKLYNQAGKVIFGVSHPTWAQERFKLSSLTITLPEVVCQEWQGLIKCDKN